MTASELAKLVGMEATLRVDLNAGHLNVEVHIVDSREAYGRTDLLVTTDGKSKAWVSADRVKVRKS